MAKAVLGRHLAAAIVTPVLTLLACEAIAQRPGTDPAASNPQVFFYEDFESGSLDRWDENSTKDKPERLSLVDGDAAFMGRRCALFTALVGEGQGAKLNKWFMPGHDRVYARWYFRLAPDYAVTQMHGCHLLGNRPDNKYSAYGKAGWTPSGEDFFTTGLDLRPIRTDPPDPQIVAYRLEFYTYHLDKQPGFGAPFRSTDPARIERDRWYCAEIMLKVNTPGEFDGEQAFWVDGRLQGHFTGLRWRTSELLKVNDFWLELYVHNSQQLNRMWFDNVALSTEYIGTVEHPGDQHPTADFYTRGEWGTRTVACHGTPSTDPDGEVRKYTWDFGDGSPTTTGHTVTHEYAADGEYTVSLTVADEQGATHSASRTVPVSTKTGTGTGLMGHYYSGTGFEQPRVTRLDPQIDFDWKQWDRRIPAINVDPDTFTVRWTGNIQPLVTGEHTFAVVSADEAVRLWIGGKSVIQAIRGIGREPEGNTRYRKHESPGSIRLEAGGLYDIELDLYQMAPYGEARLLWEAEGLEKQLVPASQLYPL